ncbi:MAG: beta strand repeat-containing protein [Thermoleophilaceae bacterium]
MRRRLRRLLLPALGMLVVATAAVAYWTASGIGSGSGSTGTMTAAAISVPATSSGSTTVTWTSQASLPGNTSQNANITYTVERKLGAGAYSALTAGGCSGSLPYNTASCSDNSAGTGSYTYQVVAHIGGWTATSNQAGPVTTTDTTPPVVSSISLAGSSPTNASSVQFTVQFSEPVTGVDATDFPNPPTTGGQIGTVSVTGVSGSGSTYTVTVGGMTGNGTVGLNLKDDDSIVDAAGNKLGGTGTTGAANGSFTGTQVYTIDKTAPTVSSINRSTTSPTNASSVQFAVTFSESVTGVDSADFATTGTVTGASVTGVTGSGTTYTVTADTGSGDGTVGLNLVDDDSIQDTATNKLGGTGTANGNFTGQTYTIDKTAPTVSSINRAAATPTNATSVSFTVTFSESVTGVGTADFALATTGVSGASITGVSGSGTTYTVTAGTGSGDGTVGLNLVDDDSIADAVGNKLGGTGTTGAGNGSFTGQVYTIDKTAPAVSLTQVNGSTQTFPLTFNSSITSVGGSCTTADGSVTVTVTGTGAQAAQTSTCSSGTWSRTLTTTISANGTSTITATQTDTATNQGTSGGKSITIDKTAPTVSSINLSTTSPTNATSVQFTVTFSESVTGVDSADFALATSNTVTGASVTGVAPVSGTTYTVTADTGSGDGTIGLNLVDDDSIQDAATNKLGGTGTANGNFTGQTYTIDKTAPTVSSINRAAATPTKATSGSFNVTFSESVTGVGAGDFALATTGVTGASITNVTGSLASYTVTVGTGSGDGTIGLNLVDDDSIADTAGNKLGGTGTTGAGNGSFTGQTYTIDKTAPTVTLTQVNGTTQTFAFTTNQSVTSVGGACSTGDGNVTVTVTGNGAQTPPSVACSSGSWTQTLTTISAEGTSSVTATQTDAATNQGSSGAKSITVDKTAPTVTLTSPANNASLATATPSFSGAAGTATGDVATITVSIYSGSIVSGNPVQTRSTTASAGSWSVSASPALSDGTYTAQAGQVDQAGNIATSTARTFTVDTVAPDPPILGAPSDNSFNTTGNVTVSGTAEPASTITVSDGGAPLAGTVTTDGAGNWTKSITGVADGSHTYTATAKDAALNTSAISNSRTVIVDKIAPTVTITAPTSGSRTNNPTPTISGTAGNATTPSADSTTVSINIYSGATATGIPVQTLSATRSGTSWSVGATTLSEGTYTAQATQQDAAGNTGTSTAVTFTVDTTAPTASDFTTTNKTNATAGTLEKGDSFTLTFSEQMSPGSIQSGWTGSIQNVVVRLTDAASNDVLTVYDITNATQVNLGSVALGGNYTSSSTTFGLSNGPSTMLQSGAAITITLGGGASGTLNVAASAPVWTPSTAATDLAGNALTGVAVTKSSQQLF